MWYQSRSALLLLVLLWLAPWQAQAVACQGDMVLAGVADVVPDWRRRPRLGSCP